MKAIESPCILVCVIEPKSGYCYGCGRTGSEIADWSTMNNDTRTTLVARLGERVATLERRPRRMTRRRMQKEQRNSTQTTEDTA